jgi:carbonic anhydrase/acetyltransferase-like protein (isoleucine patch superfamily)
MKTHVLLFLCLLVSGGIFAQKTVYIPPDFSSAPLNTWSYSKSYQSANFVVFWGNIVGTDPANYSDANLRFNPQSICDTLEKIYTKFVTELGFCSDAATKNLGKYKLIIVMNDTWGTNGPSGWAFGGTYGNTIGAMWVHPNATRDGGVISHELTHSLQGMISIQENTVGGGYINYDPSGFFWEAHANYMRTQMYPKFAGDDLPRWLGTQSFHLSSTRHHYGTFKWLYAIQDVEGIEMVNRLWKESVTREHPLVTYRRLKGWTQAQLNDFLYEYAKKEATYDYTVNNFGIIMRGVRDALKRNEPHYLWRQYTVLSQVNATTGRYVVSDASAPQDYGYNIIPLYPTCSSRNVTVKFKGHTEVNTTAGWRYGFVAAKADGTVSRYGALSSANESEISFQMNTTETQLYLVVLGAPTTHTSYVWEPGFPKIKRYPYEVSIANAMPEGYQSTFRSEYKTSGRVHANGGGWVASTATVASTVYVGPGAIVRGSSNISGNVRIEGTAWVESATVQGSVVIGGNANVWFGTYSGTATIGDNAILNYCTVSGNANIKGNAMEWGVSFGTGVNLGGDVEIGSCSTAGVYLQVPHPNNGRSECDGKSATDASNVDVNATYALFTDAQMAFTGSVVCPAAAATVTDTHETVAVKEVEVYPNPVVSSFNVSMRNFSANEVLLLSLYDSQGKVVLNRKVKGGQNVVLDAASARLQPGVYVLKVTGSTVFTKKIVITR